MPIRYRFVSTNSYKSTSTPLFKDFMSEEELFTSLIKMEKTLGKFRYYSGIFRFKPGFYSKYKDGTEPRVVNNPRWWKTGAKSCCMGCCTLLPDGESYSNTEPAQFIPKGYQKDWQEFKRIAGIAGAYAQFKEIEDKSQLDKIIINEIGWFYVESY